MILDKVKQLHKEYGGMSDKDCATLGFTPRIENRATEKLFLINGNWNVLQFYQLKELDLSKGIMIIPHLPGTKWPVYHVFNNGGTFCADSMLSNILYSHVERLNEHRDLCQKYADNWATIEKIVLPVYELFGGADGLQDIKDIVFDKQKWPGPDPSEEDLIASYRAFCLKRDPSFGNRELWNLLDKLIENKDFIPDVPEADYGIYRSRIMKLAAMRAYKLEDSCVFDKLKKMLFNGFKEPHGYDVSRIYPGYYPDDPAQESYNLERIARLLIKPDKDKQVPQELWQGPESKAAEALVKQGISSFTGMEFMEAAAILDEEHKEPLRAWNCLVSAGYWAGQNLPDAQETIVKAAIYLCEKHNWLEAAEVLKYNLDIMLSV